MLKDERGAVLPVFVIMISIVLLGLAVLWDWSMVQIHWRGLHTATDAAALAGAMDGDQHSCGDASISKI